MRGKQNLANALDIQKENWGGHAVFRISLGKKKSLHRFASLQTACLAQIFYLDFNSSC